MAAEGEPGPFGTVALQLDLEDGWIPVGGRVQRAALGAQEWVSPGAPRRVVSEALGCRGKSALTGRAGPG